VGGGLDLGVIAELHEWDTQGRRAKVSGDQSDILRRDEGGDQEAVPRFVHQRDGVRTQKKTSRENSLMESGKVRRATNDRGCSRSFLTLSGRKGDGARKKMVTLHAKRKQ